MKVKLIRGCVIKESGEGKTAKPRKEGETVNVSDNDGRYLIASGLAVEPEKKASK